jgi:PAS domain S-box-containing protein
MKPAKHQAESQELTRGGGEAASPAAGQSFTRAWKVPLRSLLACWSCLKVQEQVKRRPPPSTAPPLSAPGRIRGALQELNGLLVTMAMIIGLEGVLWHNINILYLPLVLVLAVAFAAYVGGTRQGLLSAALACVFLAFYLFAYRRSSSHWVTNALVWTTVLASVALLTGYLRHRAREQEFKPWLGNVAPFRVASDSLPDLAVILLDRAGRVTTWNTGAERLFGRRAEEMAGQTIARCCRSATVEAGLPETALQAAAGCGSFEGEWECAHQDLTPFRARIAIVALRDEQGEVVGYTLSARDLSERQEAAAALLRRAHQQVAVAALSQDALAGADLRVLLEHAVTFIMQTGSVEFCDILELQPDGRTLLMRAGVGWKSGCAGTLRVPAEPDSILGYAIESSEPVILKDLNKITRLQVPDFLREHGIVSSLMVSIPGRPRPFGLLGVHTRRPASFEEGDLSFLHAVAGVLASAQARKVAESELGKLAAFPQCNPNPVFEVSSEGVLTYYNDAASRLASSLKLGRTSEMLPPDHARVVRECLAAQVNHTGLVTQQSGRTLHWSFHPIPEIGRVHVYAQDVTDRLNLEAQLRQSQKMEAIGQLAAGVAHDFNNLLTIMQGYASRLLTDSTHTPRSGDAEEILNATERAASLTRQLLAFSRRQTLQPRLLNLADIVSDMVRMLERLIGENIRLEVKHAAALPPVSADSGMVEQILLNLVVNARDAMPTGGALQIETTCEEISHTDSTTHPQARAGRFVCLRVTDTGCGMDQETLARIFDPFFTTKGPGQGTGLGLATVYGITQQHQGWIEVRSEVGRGTTFAIFLPAAEGHPEMPKVERKAPGPSRGGQETILIVEDEEILRLLTRTTLERLGYHLLEAASGPEAIDVWRQHHDEVDMLFTDLVMPGGMNGRQLCEQLRREKPGLKVIFSSGYGADCHCDDLLQSAGVAYLQKPYRPPALAQTVRQCLDAN